MTTEATPDTSGKTETLSAETGKEAATGSLLDTGVEGKTEEGTTKTEGTVDPNSGKAWVLSEGIQGVGEQPAWYKKDKYKSVADQAKAYTELEGRFGAFKGAPKNEKGEVAYQPPKVPEGIKAEFDLEHPTFKKFNEFAGKNNMSQEAYDAVLGMFAESEASKLVDMGEVKKALGENADARIVGLSKWTKANLGAEGFEMMREATKGQNAASVFKLMEQLVSKTAQAKLPKVGDDVVASGGGGMAAIKAEHEKRDAKGQLLYQTDSTHRNKVEKMYADYYAAQQ